MLTFSKMFHGDFKRQIMKQPWTKKQKFRFWTKRRAKNNKNNEKPSLDLALRAAKKKTVVHKNYLNRNSFCSYRAHNYYKWIAFTELQFHWMALHQGCNVQFANWSFLEMPIKMYFAATVQVLHIDSGQSISFVWEALQFPCSHNSRDFFVLLRQA